MPNPQHYSGSSAMFPQSRQEFTSNTPSASIPSASHHPPQHQHHQQQSYQPDQAYLSYGHPAVRAPYPQSGNGGYAHQSSQMPAAPADRRYAQHYDVQSPRDQPQFQQTRYPENYPQYGYPAGNAQSAYAAAYPPGGSGGYPQPGSTASAAAGQQGYMNGNYPPPGTHSSHLQYPPVVHSSGQMSVVADRPGAHSRDGTGSHPQSQQFGVTRNAGPPAEPAGNPLPRTAAHQQPAGTEQYHTWSADNSSHQSKNHDTSNVANRRQTSQQNNPHIVKPAVLNPEATGKFLYLLSLLLLYYYYIHLTAFFPGQPG